MDDDYIPQPETDVTDEPRSLFRVLAHVSALLAPAGLVALFCQVMEVSPQNTAAFSLITISTVALLLYRRQLSRRVPSPVVLGFMLMLASVFYFSYKNILFKDTGLIRFYRHSNDYLGELNGPIRAAKHDIWFFGTNFYITSRDRKEALIGALTRGVNVHYLIFDPDSAEMARLARDFGQSEESLRRECALGLANLTDLARAWNEVSAQTDTPGDLQVRVFEVTPRGRVYVFDPGDDRGTTFLVPYVNNVNSSELPGFLLENIDRGVYRSYFAGVMRLWKASKPLTLPGAAAAR
jgi:hypothetical protein